MAMLRQEVLYPFFGVAHRFEVKPHRVPEIFPLGQVDVERARSIRMDLEGDRVLARSIDAGATNAENPLLSYWMVSLSVAIACA
jgi:hypothetical protein